MNTLSTTNPREDTMSTTLQALDWPRLLNTPDTRWYLDRTPWDEISECSHSRRCAEMPAAYVEYQVCTLLGDTSNPNFLNRGDLVCSKHLPDLITHATGEPLVSGTVVEVGVDPALLRLTGVDPAVVDQFNKHALGVAA